MSAHDLDRGVAAPSAVRAAGVEQHQPAASRSSLPAVPVRDIDRVRARASLKALHQALELMEKDIDRLADAGDLHSLADGFASLTEFLRAAKDVQRHAEDHIARLMPQPEVNLGDEIILERHGGTAWGNWDWDAIFKEIGADRWIDPDTGERVLPALREIVPTSKSVTPKAALWNKRGVPKDEVGESWDARRTVQVTRAKTDKADGDTNDAVDNPRHPCT